MAWGKGRDNSSGNRQALVKRVLEESAGVPLGRASKTTEQLLRELEALGPASATPGRTAVKEGQGRWEVLYAPHLRLGEKLLLSKLDPVRYILRGDEVIAQVCLNSPFGSFWLCASGPIVPHSDSEVKLDLEHFWVDRDEAALREQAPVEGTALEKLVSALGRVLLALEGDVFPVRYLDRQLALFHFPLARANVAIRRIGS